MMNPTSAIPTALAGLVLTLAATASQAQIHAATDPNDPSPPATEIRSTVVQPKANGDTVIVRSGMPAAVPAGPSPAFALLDQHQRGDLDEADARAYPPLADDFINADTNRDGRISKTEYERWVRKP